MSADGKSALGTAKKYPGVNIPQHHFAARACPEERRIARREDATRCDGVTDRVRGGVRPRIERAVATTQGSGRSADEGLHSENHGNGKAPCAGRREGRRARRA